LRWRPGIAHRTIVQAAGSPSREKSVWNHTPACALTCFSA
jgi:hypothetical protein